MRSLQAAYKILLSLALICFIAASEFLYCTHSTLLSSSHFSNMLDDDKKLSQLTTMIYSSISNTIAISGNQEILARYTLEILNKTDQEWVKGQVYITATGIHKYLTSEASALPTLDFVPLNTVIKEALISDIMKQPGTNEKIGKVKTVLAILDNKYLSSMISFGINNQLTTMLLDLTPIKSTGFDRATLQEIIRIYLSFSNKSMTIDQASQSIVSEMASEALALNRLKDYFDTNIFLEKAFGDENPLATIKTYIHKTDTSISLAVKILFWCLILLTFLNCGLHLVKAMNRIAFCIVIASTINLLFSTLLVNPAASRRLLVYFYNIQVNYDSFLGRLSTFLFRDVGLYLALQSFLIIVFSAVFYSICRLISRKPAKIKNTKSRLPLWRLSLITITFMIMCSWWTFASISREAALFHKNINALRETDVKQRVYTGLIEAGGMDFLKYLQKKQ